MGINTSALGPATVTTGLTQLDATNKLSIALWWQCLTTAGADIFSHDNNGTFADGYYLYWQASAGNGFKIRTFNAATATTYGNGDYQGLSIGAGAWNHLAVSLDGSYVRFFINGILTNVLAQTANASVLGTRKTQHANTGLFLMAAQSQSDFRVWNGYAINAAEASYIARGGVLGNETARWFVGGSFMQDLTKNANLLTKSGNPPICADPDTTSSFRLIRRTSFRTAIAAAVGGSALWPALSSVVAGAINAAIAAVPQDNSKALQVPPQMHAVQGWEFSVDRPTTAVGVLQLVEDLAGSAIYHEQIELPVGFSGSLPINYPKPIVCQPGKSVALVTGGSLGASVKATGVLRGFSSRSQA